jgi:hypothetical protein
MIPSEHEKLIKELYDYVWEKYRHLDKTDCLSEPDFQLSVILNYLEKNPEQPEEFWSDLKNIIDGKNKIIHDAQVLFEKLESMVGDE